MKFLVVEQDLRVSGTSQGIISRSFLSKLRTAYPESIIDVVYLKQYASEDQLDLLPVDSIESHVLNLKIPFFTLWLNKIYWRLFHISLKERHIHKVYASYIAKIDYKKYDHIFIRSAGLNHEMLLATKDLPILQQAIINFHDPYPLFWYAGSNSPLTNLELFRMKEMHQVVNQAKTCMSSAGFMSKDMQYLYGSRKFFFTLPHQYCEQVFDFSDNKDVIKKKKKVVLSYHGAIQFGRNIDILLDAYKELLEGSELYRKDTDFILRLKSSENSRLAEKYRGTENIIILDGLNFSNSSNEQINESDILVILENGPLYCNILVGKAPFLSKYNKPILSVSPERSELRNIIIDNKYIANINDKDDIKQKLEILILDRINSEKPVYPFGDYFSDENFKIMLNKILLNKATK
jgi:hypothetical protein